MLTTLRISGFAIVDQVEVQFRPGLNVVTGETGAGKSILLAGLDLILGGRLRTDVLRDGAEEVVVEALFSLSEGHPVLERLAAAGLPVADTGEILVRRTASRTGRGRAYVNGALCTVGMLSSCLRGLADITAQHEHVSLLDEATHLPLLDSFAGIGSGTDDTLLRYRAARELLAAALRERDAGITARDERARRADDLAFRVREIESAGPRPGEDAELERERQVLAAAEKLQNAARISEALIYAEEGSAAERIGRAIRAIGEAAATDATLEPALGSLRAAAAEVEEAGRALGRYADAIGGNPERLSQVADRLAVLRALARKYGGSLEAVLAHADAARAELVAAQGAGERLAAIEAEIETASASAAQLAGKLTEAREKAARALAREVGRELDALAMPQCRIEVEFLPPDAPIVRHGVSLGLDGAQRARLLLAVNPGEPARPLARIASGGELSRIVLALKRALARVDPIDTYVFDEVDAGIGGGVAEVMGRLLSDVSRQRQVICVTHLPQVAAFADRHLKVEKRVRGGRTTAAVVALDAPEERRREVARMLAGMTLTDSALQHAGALIAVARSATAEASCRVRARRSTPIPTVTPTRRVNALTPRVRG